MVNGSGPFAGGLLPYPKKLAFFDDFWALGVGRGVRLR